MTPADIAALRTLLARAQAAGWKHLIYQRHNEQHEHVWCRDSDTIADDRVLLWNGMVEIDVANSSRPWTVPVTSVTLVAAVLELAGALPPDTARIRRAIADPGQFCPRRRWPDASGIGAWESIPAWGARAVVIALAGAS